MQAKTFAILIAVIILCFIIDLIRRQKMTFKYSLFWLSAALFTVIAAIFDQVLWSVASFAGFKLVSNFIFFLFLAFISAVCLFLTVYINEQNTRTENLAQTVGILDHQLKDLQKKVEEKK
jgi:hypothetical protein